MQSGMHYFLVIFAVVALMSLTAGIVMAAPSTQSIAYQGKLTDAAGNPLTGSYPVTFSLYEESLGGTALATDTHAVQATNGLFTTQITVDPSFFDGRGLWLGITVGSDPEMTPRQEIRPVPYALNLLGGGFSQILTVLTDIQTKVTTINTKLDTRPVPNRYEYYTGKMNGYDPSSQLWITTDTTNMGDSAANVCVIEYGQHSQLSAWKEFKNHCYLLNPHWSKTDTPTIVTNVSYSRFVKITSDSPYVAPQARFFDSYISASQPSYEYLPGDFRKVEIYE
jgi:hypothetical protein